MSMGPLYGRMGWLGIDAERRARDALYESGVLLDFVDCKTRIVGAPTDPLLQLPIWELEQKILGHQIPTYAQETGDCVSFGIKQAGERRQIIEIAAGQEERWREWYAPWIYAISRNQIGGGVSGAGSTGAWGAAAIAKYGVLFADDPDVPAYSGHIADRWGHRSNTNEPIYQKFFEIARDNPCKIVRLSNVDEVVEMIRDYRRPITIASSRGFAMIPYEYKGYHVFQPSGSWAHQMCLVEYCDELPAVYRLNSWGPDAHGKPLHGETPGGAWNLLEDLDREIKTREVEMYALVEFEGDQSEPNNNLL